MPLSGVETIVLRFRDLVTEAGQTLQNHARIITERNYVWWGWWNKAGERVPLEVFAELNSTATAKGLRVLLYDSDSNQVFEAHCTEIKFSGNAEIPSPDNAATPEYYREKRYKTWFKFERISIYPLPALELTNWTYVRVDAFFDQSASQYTEFYGKQIYSPQELGQQPRTIWFVRSKKTGDPNQEVILLDARRVAPENFSSEYKVCQGSTLLWASDLHFSESGEHGFPVKSSVAEFTLWHQIEDALNKKNISDVAGALLSGDFAWRALPEEFVKAETFVRELGSKLRLKSYDFLTCPGNHDLKFAQDSSKIWDPVQVTSKEASENYRDFYKSLFFISPNEYLACGRRLILGEAVPVEIASLNTSFLQQ